MRLRPHTWLPRRRRSDRFFAWLPKKLTNGTWVWLETVERYPSYYGRGY